MAFAYIWKGVAMLALCVLWAQPSPGVGMRLKRHASTVWNKPPRRKKGNKGNKGGKKDKPKPRGKIVYPGISLDILAAHDLDAEEARLMTEKYMRTQVSHTAGEAARCCCKLEEVGAAAGGADGTADVACEVLRGSSLGSSWNPLYWAAAVCPSPYLDWDSQYDFVTDGNRTVENWPLLKYPISCREGNLNEVLRDLVPDHRRTHEAMVIAESTLEDAVGPDVLTGVSEKCCCKLGGTPDTCALMQDVELENGTHCPSANGYAIWDAEDHGFQLEEIPSVCRVSQVDEYMRQVPRDFAIMALVASSAVSETRYALDPVVSASLHANVEVVRRRLEDIMGLLAQSIDAVRQRWEVVHNRGAWIGAEFIYAILGGSIQRALRLLTPISADDSNSSQASPWEALEKDSLLMREFINQDNIDPLIDMGWCPRLGEVSEQLGAAILHAALIKDFEDDCVAEKVQTSLRGWGAWWQTKVKGDALMELFFPEKTHFVYSWTKMRAALDFSPWPISPKGTEMIVPTICESDYLIGGETARYPKYLPRYGGTPIMHTYMAFAGGEPEKWPGCLDLVVQLAELFPKLPPRGENGKELKEYKEQLSQAEALGCHGMVPLGNAWLGVKNALEAAFKEPDAWTFELEFVNTKEKKIFEIKKGVASKKDKTSKRKKFASLETGLLKYISHTIIKYAARLVDDNWAEGVEASLRRNPPSMPAHELSADFWEQLLEQGIASPYDDAHCPDVQAKECGDWDPKAAEYWEEAKLSGASVNTAVDAVKAAHASTRKGDWALLAQVPASYGAAGFDSPGIGDNSDWKCDKKTETCNVHPRCARAAAQMISHSFMKKKYAANMTAKVNTMISNALGSFDEQGYHSYCHDYADAYCWSYTDCLKEMMKWLCHDDDTASQCCPSAEVRQACKADVNAKGCNICEKTAAPPEDEIYPPVPTYTVPDVAEETLAWLRPGLEEAALASCKVCTEVRGLHAQQPKKPIFWMWVSIMGVCNGKEDECRELCGLSEEEAEDEFANCVGWEARCYDMGCKAEE